MKLSDSFYQKRLSQQKGSCYYCGTKLVLGVRPLTNVEIDHIKPFSKHKDGTRANLCLSCKRCNRLKRDLTIEEFRLNAKNAKILFDTKFYFEIHEIWL